ncbi:hypothetical protein MPLB_640044 [Mesorhizobium sp. ORS 3324]|nr:hypothetical protein MPLB_640044 [Mesorhizobium sp. ORS 3324]
MTGRRDKLQRWRPPLPVLHGERVRVRGSDDAAQLRETKTCNKKPASRAGFSNPAGVSGLEAETFETLLELRQAAAAVEQGLLAAGPGRVRGRVDVEVHRVAFLAPGRAGQVLGAIGHDDLDGVVVGMDIGLHCLIPGLPALVTGQRPASMRPLLKLEAAANEKPRLLKRSASLYISRN